MRYPEIETIDPRDMTKEQRAKKALEDPFMIQRELNNRSLFEFIQFFWPVVSNDQFKSNWHIELFCKELEEVAERVGNNLPKKHDLIINVPPGTTKTKTISVMFPIWCWTRWYWMKFITASYSSSLALESAEESRDLIRSQLFGLVYPELAIKEDKDTKSNYKVIKSVYPNGRDKAATIHQGGNRYSTSVGGTLTGYHGHINIVDDPLNPHQAISDTERATANRWVDQTLSTRKTDKKVSTQIIVMQRLHQDDPSGHLLDKKKTNIRHISLPGEIRNYADQVYPPELKKHYVDDLLDPIRMPWEVLHEMKNDLGQYGFSGQVGQKPTPPGGGMFQVKMIPVVDRIPPENTIVGRVRYWDKAGSQDSGAYTVGLKMYKLREGTYLVVDVRRGQWGTNIREKIIKQTAEADGPEVRVYIEQEPGSGGKESAENTIRNLAGFNIEADRPTGDKIYRADPFSVQVNNGNVYMLHGDWNHALIDELENFPNSTYKDQVDAGSGAFAKLVGKKQARVI